MEQLSITRIKQIMFAAKKKANKKGFGQDGDDFAQEALLSIMQGRKAPLKFQLIDYLRANYSDPRSKTGVHDYNERVSYLELNEELCGMQNVKDNVDFSIFQNILDSKARCMMTLRYKWGLTEAEIGECFGLSEGRVSQRLKEIKEELSKVIKKDSLR